MKILFLGFSNFIQQRIIPFLATENIFTGIAIASRAGANQDFSHCGISAVFSDYRQALEEYQPDIVYISLINSLHAVWAEQGLKQGCHVIVDKPAFMAVDDMERCLSIAKEKNVCLAEALVYGCHPQFEAMDKIFSEYHCLPKKIITQFSFPPFPDGNFRNEPKLGGGALMDLGPYAASIGRLIFKSDLCDIQAYITDRHTRTKVDTGFSFIARFDKGQTLLGHFSFTTEYHNSLSIFTEGLSINLDRVYTTPANLENIIHIRHKDKNEVQKVPSCNAAIQFLSRFVMAIEKQDWNSYCDILHADTCALEKLKKSLNKDVL